MAAIRANGSSLERIKRYMKERHFREQVDFNIEVYCDLHLEVKMLRRLAVSSSEFEYSAENPQVDINQLWKWFCQKEGCARSYEPTMFGYHNDFQVMGGRLVENTSTQPRGNHRDRPFMYIGRVYQDRRFLCPIYQCNEKGDLVADSIQIEAVQTTIDSSIGRTNQVEQKEDELSVFHLFCVASRLPIDIESIVSKPTPCPDIYCRLLGNEHFFELAEIINPGVAEKLSRSRRKLTPSFTYSQRECIELVVKKKSEKRYETEGNPVDLLLYFDLKLGSDAAILKLIKNNPIILDPLLEPGPFNRIWIFDVQTEQVIWIHDDRTRVMV
jgi:hypothetical protein